MKFKLKKDSLTTLLLFLASGQKRIKYSIDGSTTTRLNMSNGIARLERVFLKQKQEGNWATAVLYCNKTKQPLHYYHHQTGLQKLNKSQFASLLQQGQKSNYNIYIVPNEKAREKGQHTGERVKNVMLSDVDLYWSDLVQKICIYKGGSLCCEYLGKGKFRNF